LVEELNIIILLDTIELLDKLKKIWKKIWYQLTDIYNRKLHIIKESSTAVDREIEDMIFRLNNKILPLRTELEKIMEIIKEKRKELRNKFIDGGYIGKS